MKIKMKTGNKFKKQKIKHEMNIKYTKIEKVENRKKKVQNKQKNLKKSAKSGLKIKDKN